MEIDKQLDQKFNKVLYEEIGYGIAIVNPSFCKQLPIRVLIIEDNEGYIPRVHVYFDEGKKHSVISLVESVYLTEVQLSNEDKNIFVDFMNSIWPNRYEKDISGNLIALSSYQAAVQYWSELYEDGSYDKFELDDRGIVKQLDYSKL